MDETTENVWTKKKQQILWIFYLFNDIFMEMPSNLFTHDKQKSALKKLNIVIF